MAKIGVQIELQGAPQYIENMSKLTAQTKLYSAQMKKVQQEVSGASAFTKSIATSKALGQELQALTNKADYLSKEIEKEAAKSDELSSREIYLKTQYENLQTEILRVTQALKDQGGVLGAVGAQAKEWGDNLQSVGEKISGLGDSLTTKVSTPIAAVGAASVKAFADWESAFAGVMKTVDESATTTYDDISEGIKKMATETASSKEEIAAVAEAAGQLGVGADDILKFTKTMVMLGDSTNLSAEEAATSLAKIANITGDSLNDVDRLGASIVALGNNFATTESDIVEMSNRIASAGTIAGLSTTDILALSTAMSSVGIEAEAGGTAMTQTLTGISKAVSESGDKLNTLAQVSGMTADEFADKWKSEPIEALQSFISGLSDMNTAGEDTYKILDDLGMSGIRQSNMLQSVALASGQLTSALEVSNKAFEENSALNDEASKRYETFNAQVSQAKETLSNVAIQIGSILMPYVQKLLKHIQNLANWFATLSPEMQSTIVHIAALIAVIGPALSIVGRVVTSIGTILSALGSVISFIPTVIGAFSSFGAVITGTIIPAITSFAGLLGTALTTAVSLITGTILPAIATIGATIASGIGAAITAIGAVITGTILPAIASLLAAIVPLLPIIAAVAAAIAAVIIVIKNWGAITDWISEKWNIFTTYISVQVAELQAFFEEHFGIIGQIISVKIEMIKIVITTACAVIKTVITTFGQVIKALFTGDWKAIGQIVKNAWDTIKNTINSAKQNIINTLTNLGQQITNIFTNLKNSALSWGKDFVQNFVDGITERMHALLDKVREMADEVRSYLHFSRGPEVGPLKDAYQWPRHFVENYAKGIESARYLVRDAVSDVASDVAVLQSPIDSGEVYNAIRSGASDATLRLAIGDREFGRALRDMGVVFSG